LKLGGKNFFLFFFKLLATWADTVNKFILPIRVQTDVAVGYINKSHTATIANPPLLEGVLSNKGRQL
jgi:hypothetical protein